MKITSSGSRQIKKFPTTVKVSKRFGRPIPETLTPKKETSFQMFGQIWARFNEATLGFAANKL